ncbi:uncharacterized protein LOC111066562 [Drosophila obscura]|uniref:uncharacterized protein LOC111066562 n=1 Tax=Drosophila obscura TaxID=7282 RepID=UPI001BB2C6F5|nr:uncharacterized protein LOC111066562 [Drosophila obscura]
MSDYYYFDVKLKLRYPEAVLFTPINFRGCVLSALESFFGDLGGKTSMDIVKFSTKHHRIIFRVPEEFFERTLTALSLIGHYQEVPCHFQVIDTSKTALDFDKDNAEEISGSC